MKKLLIAVICTVMAIFMVGCAGKKIEKTAQELAEEGSRHFEAENYAKAIESYKRLKDWYPYSPLAREAQLRVADSRFHLGEYEEAIFGYEQFENLYPNDPKIPYILYQIGLSHYERIRSIDRTQVPARNALDTFERLRSRFPASDYAQKAGPMIEECIENLANHEFYIGRFYYKAGRYKAAANRFRKVIDLYPDHLEIQKEAADYLAMAETRLAGQDEIPETPEIDPREYRRPLEDRFMTPGPDSGPLPEY
jgi:outer membrane protein assembly factor BamD